MKKGSEEFVGRRDPWGFVHKRGPLFYLSAVAAAWVLNSKPAVHDFITAPIDQEYSMAMSWVTKLTQKADDRLNVLISDITQSTSTAPNTPDGSQASNSSRLAL
jgi:hypothetical protein